MAWVAAAIVGGAVVSGIFANKAAKKQSKATQKGIDAQNALLGPYSEAGAAGLPGVQSFVDQGANFADTQAFKDITNSAKAGGQFASGNRATALTDYYATNFRPQRLNELMQLPSLGGATAGGQASNLGNLYNTQGSAQAGGVLGVGNAINSGINSLAFLNQYNQSAGLTGGQGLTNTGGAVQPGQHGFGGFG